MKIAQRIVTLDQLLIALAPVYEQGSHEFSRKRKADAILEFLADKESSDRNAELALEHLEKVCLLLRLDWRSDDLYSRTTEALAHLCELMLKGLGEPVREIMQIEA